MEAILKNTGVPDWLILLLIGCLLLVAIVKWLYPQRFKEFLFVLVTNSFFMVHSKSKVGINTFSILLLIIQIISVVSFLFLLAVQFLAGIELNDFLFFTQLVVVYSVFISLKYFVENFVADISNSKEILHLYLYQKFCYRSWLALFLLPVIWISLFVFPDNKWILIITLITALVLNLVFLFNAYRLQEKIIRTHLFYFILYLCALEISPYIFIYKVLVFN